MPTRVVVIDVDLGFSVDDIVADEITSLTTQSKTEIDRAIEIARTAERIKQEREQKAKLTTDKLTIAIEAAYNTLKEAGELGVPVTTIMSIVEGTIPNSSAFTLRMKRILTEKGNPFILERKKHQGTPHYVFVPYSPL